jgi:hypothetical protein
VEFVRAEVFAEKLRTVALGEVVDDGTLVSVGPGVPVQGQGVAGVGLDVLLAGLRALVAGDVGAGEGARGDKAVILVHGLPAGRLGGRARGLVVPIRVGTLDELTLVDLDAGHVTVGRGYPEKGQGESRD